MIEYKGFIIVITLPSRQHANATSLMQVRKDGITLKCYRYKANYPSDKITALQKAKLYIDKQLTASLT